MTLDHKGIRSSQNHEPTLHDVMGILNTMNTRMDASDTQLSSMNQTLGAVKDTLGEVQEELTSALTALDTDSIKLLNHEKRIRRLEKSAA
jgi:DNA repair ATPase RecN